MSKCPGCRRSDLIAAPIEAANGEITKVRWHCPTCSRFVTLGKDSTSTDARDAIKAQEGGL